LASGLPLPLFQAAPAGLECRLRRNCGKIGAIVEAAFACQRRLEERVNGPSTTTRNQINENSLVEENFLGGPLVVYCPRAAGYPDGKHPDRRLPEF
jgi:hypothetical protein